MTELTTATLKARRTLRMARNVSQEPGDDAQKANEAPLGSQPKRMSKQDLVTSLLRRKQGALLTEMVEATGWLPHTVRAALTGLRKKGHNVASVRFDKVTCYSIAAE